MVVVMVNEGLYTSGGNLTVVGNLLVADPEAIEIHEARDVFLRESWRLTWSVRHKPMMFWSNLRKRIANLLFQNHRPVSLPFGESGSTCFRLFL